MFKMSIGENLKKIRNEFGLTQEEFANIAGVSPSTISSYETDKRQLTLKSTIKIADEFGLTIDEVVGHYVEDPKI